ncbi:hypothetical protein [Salinimicrobium terrae]|uniref:hypothetical protein n=1 Tax=Salinimicrobium terrae TaxID=470866 RepID=UPI0003FD26CA|nr:hypothetical protein [Salinimicrobium terrae]
MKKFYLLLVLMVVGFSTKAAPAAEGNFDHRGYENAVIFVERGVEFAVFPDGQFDFFFNPRNNFNRIPSHINYSFNSGYDYGPFVQYDDFGAVIQIENVPVYYDYYGRIIQAGRVKVSYNAFGMVHRVGNLFVHYDPYHRYSHTSGFINNRNVHYVYRPWHDHYMRPFSEYTVVYHQPYRLYYEPNRMRYNSYKKYYHNNYYNNNSFQKSYYRPGERVTSYHRGKRTEEQKRIRTQNASPRESAVSAAQYREEKREIRRSTPATNRADARARASRVETPAVQQRVVRQNRAANVPAERSVQQRSRSASVNATPARQVQAQARTQRSTTVSPATVQETPASTRSRSSRGRN